MTRDDILDAAAQVIRQKGFHGASMADIAEAVKLQKASLYHHVSSKQEILLALLDRALEMLFEQIDVIAKKPLPADEKLRQMVQVYLRLLADNSDLSAVLLFEHRSLEPAQHKRHIPNRDRFEALWQDTLDDGVKNGVFDCSDTALVTRALMGVLNWTLTWYRSNGSLSIEQIADQYTTLLLNGLLKDG
jgi:TetR/AcrR family transcriptional regulator, cholesterol catabolism regulator